MVVACDLLLENVEFWQITGTPWTTLHIDHTQHTGRAYIAVVVPVLKLYKITIEQLIEREYHLGDKLSTLIKSQPIRILPKSNDS